MNFSELFNTLRHLRLRQVIYRLKYRLYKADFCVVDAPTSKLIKFLPWVDKPKCFDGDKFDFLNISDKFHSWNCTEHGMLWAYNLNYMDWLLQGPMTEAEGAKWIDKFIAELPQNSIGLDPYPTALRGINWIKFMSKYGGRQAWEDSLYSQYILLTKKIEYHLLGNHLLEDAYSLFIAAIYFNDKQFYKKAEKLLRQELDEQILPDGAHYEQSPMYHCILLDRLLDCCNFSFDNIRFEDQEDFNDFLCDKTELMLGHLESICYADGSIPLLNDSAIGIAPTIQELKNYATRLGIRWGAIEMNECGYRRLNNNKFDAIVDVGNITATYQPGHTHADTFSYELRIDGKPFIIDTGISTYNKTAQRREERSTAAHNTVTIDNRNSSEVWDGFRVGKRAKVTILSDNKDEIKASHDGYGKKRLHIRHLTLSKNAFKVEDRVLQSCKAVSFIHLSPSVNIISYDNKEVITNLGNIRINNAVAVELCNCTISEQYNILISTKVIKINFDKNLSYIISV